MKLNEFLNTLGYDISGLREARQTINEYFRWYKGYDPAFHNYRIYNGENYCNKKRFSLSISKRVCENFADLLMNEKVTITLGNKQSNKIIDEVLKANDFHLIANQAIEKTFALGTGAFLLSLEDIELSENENLQTVNVNPENLRLQIVEATNIYPLNYNGREITECAFTSNKTEFSSQLHRNLDILDLQLHTLDENKNYVITNYRFIESETGELTEVDDYKGILRTLETGSNNKWFFIIKPNIINNIDFGSPFGASIYANSISTIKALDISYDTFVFEILYGRKRIYITADGMKVGSDGTYKPSFDTMDTVYYLLGSSTDEKPLIKEDSGNLRIDELTKAIQMNLNLLSMKMGMGSNYYSFENGNITKTATEIISENNTLFETLKKHEILLEALINKMIKTIGEILQIDTNDLKVCFDDSIIESNEQKRMEWERALTLDVVSREEFRQKWLGETIEEATENIKLIDSKKESGPQIDFMEIEGA
jgi:A118 family predicted phage portal protein